MSIRVLVADDHPVVRAGLRLIIERSGQDIVIVGEAADGMELLALAKTTPADVYILDITMPNLNGIDTARELLKAQPTAKIIVLSLHDTMSMVDAALAIGASGFLTKEMSTQNVVDAIVAVHAGRQYLCPRVAHFLDEGPAAIRKRGATRAALTGQERKVLQLIAEGYSTKEAAAVLGLSANTVHAHRKSLMAKLDLHKQADLIRYAIKLGVAKL